MSIGSSQSVPDRGAVVITGASSGIGRATALALQECGFRVFGTVRKPEDCAALEVAGCEPFVMDITDSNGILRVRSEVLEALGVAPLAGLVNNAGIAKIGPWEHIGLDDVRRVLEVNVLGTVAVTQAFLPRLRADRGRLVIIGSVQGRVAGPFLGAYASSKSAVRAMSDSLRRELSGLGVHVVMIEAGATRTPIWEKLKMEMAVADAYASAFDWFQRHVSTLGKIGLAPEVVARAVERAMTVRKPPSSILVVNRPNFLYRIFLGLPARLMDSIFRLRMKPGKHRG